MDKYKKEAPFSKYKEKTNGFVKQLFLSIGLAIALLVFMLVASGIFFTGAVVLDMNAATRNSRLK